MTYNDITYCSRECANMECKRNQKHLPKGPIIISMAEFTDCENWYVGEADKMFKELGYKRSDFNGYIYYESWGEDIVFNLETKDIYIRCEEDGECVSATIDRAELKAINKKCQELGWE